MWGVKGGMACGVLREVWRVGVKGGMACGVLREVWRVGC